MSLNTESHHFEDQYYRAVVTNSIHALFVGLDLISAKSYADWNQLPQKIVVASLASSYLCGRLIWIIAGKLKNKCVREQGPCFPKQMPLSSLPLAIGIQFIIGMFPSLIINEFVKTSFSNKQMIKLHTLPLIVNACFSAVGVMLFTTAFVPLACFRLCSKRTQTSNYIPIQGSETTGSIQHSDEIAHVETYSVGQIEMPSEKMSPE